MKTLPMEGRVEVEVDASPEAVWDVVSDPTRTGEWSHEARSVVWADGAGEAVPGARFRGSNRQGRVTWSRTCEVVAIVPGRSIVWRTIRTRRFPDSTDWTIEVEPLEGGRSRITERYDVTSVNPVISRLYYLLVPAHRDRTAALREDLVRIGEVAARGTGAAVSGGASDGLR